ncbi:MAG: hypothetical protein K6A76_00615 [Oribacterium sp.]|nr:hypothetical protein [Oribacterium sp.]
MECCGTPFKIGDSIEWHVISADRLIRPFDIDGLEYAYDAHFDDWDGIYTLKGVVKNISVYYEKFELVPAPGHNMLKPVPETSQVITTASSEDVGKYRGELQVSGNIVELDEVTVNLAKKIPGCKNH